MPEAAASEREMRYRESQRDKGLTSVKVWVPEHRAEDIKEIAALWRGDLVRPSAMSDETQSLTPPGGFQHEWSNTKYGELVFKLGAPLQRAMPSHNALSWGIVESVLRARKFAHFRTLEAATRGHEHGDKAHQGRGSGAFVRYCMRSGWIVPVNVQDEVDSVLERLNAREIRCTYKALAEYCLFSVVPQLFKYLGEKRPEASWVVKQDTLLPTGYDAGDLHPNLAANDLVITTASELRALMDEPS